MNYRSNVSIFFFFFFYSTACSKKQMNLHETHTSGMINATLRPTAGQHMDGKRAHMFTENESSLQTVDHTNEIRFSAHVQKDVRNPT